MLVRRQPAWFFGLAVLAFVTATWSPYYRIEQVRSFFGVHRVVEHFTGRFRLLLHGTTRMAPIRIRNADGTPVTGRPEPTTYYYFGGPIGDAIAAFRAAQGRLARVAVVGLGTGSLACHRQQDGEAWTLFESIRLWSVSRAIRPCSGSCRHADWICASCWEMRG